MENKKYVQYGCGLCAPKEWENFDISPTLRIQKTFILGSIVKKYLNVVFPDNVKYGDIVKGLPVTENTADAVYCSHTLEHLALADLKIALANTLKILKPGGTFRCVVPDLEYYSRQYIAALDKGDEMANYNFLGGRGEVLMGVEIRERGIKGLANSLFGNSHHLWMWDYLSLAAEFKKAGFKNIRRCKFNDANDSMFLLVEDSGRFSNALAIEANK
jgi:SAM-dependent methyltransferase